jgi:hypothetical protein
MNNVELPPNPDTWGVLQIIVVAIWGALAIWLLISVWLPIVRF